MKVGNEEGKINEITEMRTVKDTWKMGERK